MRPSLSLRAAILSLPALLLLGIATPRATLANTIVWTNTAGGNWNASGNWNSGAGPVPGLNDDAVFSTAGTYTVTLTPTASCCRRARSAAPARSRIRG